MILWKILYELSIIIRKNFHIWKRRYVGLAVEICVPIIVTLMLFHVNTKSAVFRSMKLDELNSISHGAINKSKEHYYDRGNAIPESIILNYTLCQKQAVNRTCYIGYVADDETSKHIFEHKLFLWTSTFHEARVWKPGDDKTNGTVFVRFPSEEDLLTCLAEPENCKPFKGKRRDLLFFRAAIIFETGLHDLEIRYKIRLLEKYYNSLRHVTRTNILRPSIFDKREFVKSYLASGFLSLQFNIDRWIISYLSVNGYYPNISKKIDQLKDKLSLREMPHRLADLYDYSDEEESPHEIQDDYDFVGRRAKEELSAPELVKISVSSMIVLVLSLSFLVPFEERRLVQEKESGLTMLLRVTGMSYRMQWIGNLLSVVLLYSITVTVMVFILTLQYDKKEGAVFELVSPVVLWLIFMLYVINITALCSMFSTFFEQSAVAMTATTSILFATFIASSYHVQLMYDGLNYFQKFAICLHPCIGLQVALMLLVRYESIGLATSILTIGHKIQIDGMTLAYIMLLFILQTCVFMLLTAYLNLVLPSKTGANLVWYYPCRPSHYRRKGKVSPVTVKTGNNTQIAPSLISKLNPPQNARTNSVAGAREKSKSVIVDPEEDSNMAREAKKSTTATVKSTRKSLNMKGSKINASKSARRPSKKIIRKRGSTTPRGMSSLEAQGDEPCFEPYPEDQVPSVETFNLTKKYGGNAAVDNVSIKLFHGEIFALIGRNGCGKSTFLNLFSGYATPTSGKAKICGFDLSSQLIQIQSFTGMCPQNAVLFDDLSPLEHLIIFGRLRGLKGHDVSEQAEEFIEKLNLSEMRHMYARNLASGDARKLSLAIALIGNPKVVILDEPTGGMDYYSRRVVWDLLLKIRSNHTIIFTTAFMDEAGLYGDKIGIMERGRMEVKGSQYFIRQFLGLGYSLKMTVDPSRKLDSREILSVVRQTMPSATLNTLEFSSNSDHICNVNLPEDGYSANSMSALFSDLSKVKDSMGILGFSVAHATLNELFLALMHRLDPKSVEVVKEEDENTEDYPEKLSGFMLSLGQFLVVFKKRMQFSLRNKTFTFFHIFLPMVTAWIALIRISASVDMQGRKGDPLELSLDSYDDPKTTFTESEIYSKELLEAVFGKSAKFDKNFDVTGDLIHADYIELRNRRILAFSTEPAIDPEEIIMHFSAYALHSSALAVHYYFRILLKQINPILNLTTINHPLPHPYFTTGTFFEDDLHGVETYCALGGLAWTLSVAFAAVYPMQERFSDMKHLQLMAGVSSFNYWLACLCGDLIMYFLGLIGVLLLVVLYTPVREINKSGELTLIRLLFVSTTVYAGSTLTYFCSHFAYSISGSFALCLTSGLLFGTILPYLSTSSVRLGVNLLDQTHVSWAVRFNPFHATASFLQKLGTTMVETSKCNYFTELGKKYYCDETLKEKEVLGTYRVSCCPNCHKIPGARNCFDRDEIFGHPWSERYHSYQDFKKNEPSPIRDIHAVVSHSIFTDAAICMGFAVLFHISTVFMDCSLFKYGVTCVLGIRGTAYQTEVEDDDVNDEIDRVENMVESGEQSKDMLVAYRLCKTYGVFPAVHNISFGVHPGECFGILGVNGAGKSTLLRMLTGSTIQTFGNVYSVDCSLTKGRTRLMKKMGHLSHKDITTVSYLTIEEHLILFSKLRGESSKECKKEIDNLLKKLCLEEYKHMRTESLSAGVQRSLCIALALIGKPPIVLLDEPTSLADPLARSHFWRLIKDARKSGQTIIFNSHRIIESEELCDRVAILIDGKFQCIGSPSHIKRKFASGFKLQIKLVPGHAENREYVSALSDTVVDIFNPCTLRDRRRNVIEYVIHDSKISWDYLFQQMEHIKLRYNDMVEDYSFSETRLEEVFLSNVILQHCGRIRKE